MRNNTINGLLPAAILSSLLKLSSPLLASNNEFWFETEVGADLTEKVEVFVGGSLRLDDDGFATRTGGELGLSFRVNEFLRLNTSYSYIEHHTGNPDRREEQRLVLNAKLEHTFGR
jgi:hypothetical protein